VVSEERIIKEDRIKKGKIRGDCKGGLVWDELCRDTECRAGVQIITSLQQSEFFQFKFLFNILHPLERRKILVKQWNHFASVM
jgi:hypothetical protein